MIDCVILSQSSTRIAFETNIDMSFNRSTASLLPGY